MLCIECLCAMPGWVMGISVSSTLSPLPLVPCNMTIKSVSLPPSPFILPSLRPPLANRRHQKQSYANLSLVYGGQEYPHTLNLTSCASWKNNTETCGPTTIMTPSGRQPQTWHVSKSSNEKRPWALLLKSPSLLQSHRPAELQSWPWAVRRYRLVALLGAFSIGTKHLMCLLSHDIIIQHSRLTDCYHPFSQGAKSAGVTATSGNCIYYHVPWLLSPGLVPIGREWSRDCSFMVSVLQRGRLPKETLAERLTQLWTWEVTWPAIWSWRPVKQVPSHCLCWFKCEWPHCLRYLNTWFSVGGIWGKD